MSAPSLSRQQKRKLRRGFLERGQRALARGLPRQLLEDDSLGVALVLRDVIADRARPRRASELAGLAETLLERTLARDLKGEAVACRKGCAWCCNAVVTCSAPEVFRLAHWLRENGAGAGIDVDGALAAARDRSGLDARELLAAKPPCPLLVDRACGVYEVRPLACRALMSTSDEACRQAMVEDRGQVPVLMWAMDSGALVRTLMLAAVRACGLPDNGLDLSGALLVAMADPAAEARWLAGENVFQGVRSAGRDAAARTAQDRLVEMMRALEE